MAIPHDLIVGVAGMAFVFIKIIEGSLKIVWMNVLLPPVRVVRDFVIRVAAHFLEAWAQPFFMGILQIPIPDSVQKPVFDEVKYLRIGSYKPIQLAFENMILIS